MHSSSEGSGGSEPSLLTDAISIEISCIDQNVIYESVPARYNSKKGGKDQERYNQVPHLTQFTTWESNKNALNITNKSQEVSPFPAGDGKAAMN